MSQGTVKKQSEDALSGRYTVGTFSPALALLPGAAACLGAEALVCVPRGSRASELCAIASWAGDANEAISRQFAVKHGLPWWRVSPGLLYRVGIRGHAEPPLSLLVDEDARSPVGEPLLVRTLTQGISLSVDRRDRVQSLMARMRQHGISKWNNSSLASHGWAGDGPCVLVAEDEPTGEGAPSASLQQLLDAARREHPEARILVRPGRGRAAYVNRRIIRRRDPRISLVDELTNPFTLLASVHKVYVANAQLGFEALVAHKDVTCFGTPWYAGWGLTDDRGADLQRPVRRSLEELFFAAYVQCPRYADPESGKPFEAEDAFELVERQLRIFEENQGTIYCHGFTMWKRTFVRAYLRSPGNRIVFARTARHPAWRKFNAKSKLLVWGTKEEPEIAALAKRHQVPVWRMEDGFLRSVGLGADLTVPSSLVIDREGIYFDPNTPSSLETLLQTHDFSAQEIARAGALRERIVAAALSKYNVGNRAAQLQRPNTKKSVILVPGQVEDDASIQRGCRDVRSNAGLLQAVREANPGAYILFKPHPDVTHAKRVGAVSEELALKYADEVLVNVPLPACLAIVDEVHTLTSLVGFEALLRGLKVAAYGLPFYAGWGLTHDRHVHERRTRKLALDELVAGVLFCYPRYLSARTRMFTTPEAIVRQLKAQLEMVPKPSGGGRLQRELRRATHVLKGWVDVP